MWLPARLCTARITPTYHRRYVLCRGESGIRLIVSHRITPSSIVFYGAPRVIKPCDPGSAAPCCPNRSAPVGHGYAPTVGLLVFVACPGRKQQLQAVVSATRPASSRRSRRSTGVLAAHSMRIKKCDVELRSGARAREHIYVVENRVASASTFAKRA
jgi:hypothetical protein